VTNVPSAADLVIDNGVVLTFDGDGVGERAGPLLAAQGRIVAAGTPIAPDATRIDAGGRVVAPGLIDPHAHPVFAGERAFEFALRMTGRSYEEIAALGGGILATVRATRAASDEALASAGAERLSRMAAYGVTTCEGKSGYSLDIEGELRLLRILRDLGCVPTLLAHAVPPEVPRDEYVRRFVAELIPSGLARFCDVFCDRGAFTLAETRRILLAARERGLGLRVHAEQLSYTGAAELAAELGAASADHLELVSPAGIEALARANTVAVLLPGAALTLCAPWPPARRMIDAGVTVALGTDCNPGTSMTESLPLMMTLACTQMRLTVEEAWRAVTVNAARSLLLDDAGRLAPGCRADIAVFDLWDWRALPYHFGPPLAWMVFKEGRVIHRAASAPAPVVALGSSC
jgi:imidazolonepropionase